MIQKIMLSLREAVSGKFISFIVLLSIFVSVTIALLFRVVGLNLNNYIDKKFASSIPPNVIKISPAPPKKILFFEIKGPGTGVIDDSALKKISRLKGIREIHPVMPLRVPVQARVSFLGFGYTTDAIALGVPYELIREDIAGDKYRRLWISRSYGKNVSVLIPGIMLTAYNSGLAEANRLPKLSEKELVGYTFRFLVGHSSIAQRDNYDDLQAVVSGFTGKIDALAILLPLDAVEHYNKKFIGDTYLSEYAHLFARAKDHESMVHILRAVGEMGYVAEAEKSVSEQILNLKKTVNTIVQSLMYLIILISSVAVSFSSVISTFSRIEYYRILRIIGASKIFITFSVILKYLLLGFVGSAGGILFIKFVTGRISGILNIPIIQISFAVIGDDMYRNAVIFGTIIPALSSVPALIKLFYKDLTGD